MKKATQTFFLLLLLAGFSQLQAADLLVQEQGPAGTFPTITSAVDSASDGDRILILNRSGMVPWQENITVEKSLTFLPAIDGTRFLVVGEWTIAPSAAGKAIRIVGMENVNGNIQAQANAPTGQRTLVEIVGCDLSGTVALDYNNFDVLVAGNILNDDIVIRYGNVYGNDLPFRIIRINSDGAGSDDFIDVVGNRCGRINWQSSSHFFRINNNLVSFGNSGGGSAILIGFLRNSPTAINVVENNSIVLGSSGGSKTGIFMNGNYPANSRLNLTNNAVDDQSSSITRGIELSGGITGFFLTLGYNHLDLSLNSKISASIPFNGTDVTNQNISISTATGIPTGPAIQDGGHPGKAYTDHDLSRNDPGCYGGSFNFNNYFMLPNGPQVIHVETPRTVLQGANINVNAQGFDR